MQDIGCMHVFFLLKNMIKKYEQDMIQDSFCISSLLKIKKI